MAMKILERYLGGGVGFLVLSGDLLEDSTYERKTLLDYVDRLIGNGAVLVVLDLAHVARVDALGVGEIAEAARHAWARGADLKLLRPQPLVDRLLSITRLRTVVDVCDCEEEVFRRTAGRPVAVTCRRSSEPASAPP